MNYKKVFSDARKSRKSSIQLNKLKIIILSWLFIGWLITNYDHFCLQSELSAGSSESYTYIKNLGFNLAAAFLGSLLGGIWLIFYVNEKARNKPYGYTLFLVAISFFVIVTFITILFGALSVKYETDYWPYVNTLVTNKFHSYLTNPMHLKNILVWGCVVLMTQFFLNINDKFGQGLLWAFIKGKYHSPKEELRIFMFLDLISSTTIAEKLGNENYYNLIRDFFADITDAIIYNSGRIYQYAGDEIIISWQYNEQEIHYDCLHCYFDIREKIASLKEKYEAKYGLVPDFKAALHYGYVTAGEIGIIKRDLTYSGDVLNTTSRIMAKCKEYNKKLLISGKLYQYLSKKSEVFDYLKMGEGQLRGKREKIDIYAVAQN